MKKLNEDIKSGVFEKVYLLYGEENFLKNSYKKRLKQAIIGEDDMNYNSFDGKDIVFSDIKGIAETMPFFSEHRLILIEESGLCASSAQEWAEYISQIPDGTHIVFVESHVDKRNKLYKEISKNGYAVELKRQSERDIKRWIVGILAKKNLKITEEALELILIKNGDDMERIHSEMEKLSAYCMGQEGVYPSDVQAICSELTVNRIFEMIEAVAAGNERTALELYYDLLALKEPSMRILFLIAKQFNQLMQIKDGMAAGKRKDELAAGMKLRPFIAGKLMTQARTFTKEELKQYVEICVDSEEAVKTGKLTDKLAVEMVLIKIARR